MPVITDTQIDYEGTLIDKAAFEVWVDRSDKREWGDLEGETGKLTWDEYYDSIYLTSDLKEFLTVREAKTGKLKNMYDLGKGLQKLLKQSI